VKFSVSLPSAGSHSTWEGILAVTQAAEEGGFSGVHGLDHLLAPTANTEPYGRIFEPIVTLANLAARTSRLELVTSVLIVAMRDPITAAKQAAVLDLMSGGRLVMGVGAGWLEEEFINVGADFHSRGARTDEAIRLFRHLWSGSHEPFHGRYHSFSDFTFSPLPPRASIPILVGGHSEGALRRAARLGDRWQATWIGTDPAVSLREHAELVRRLRSMEGGGSLPVGARIWWGTHLAGSPEEMVAQVGQWEEAGCSELCVAFGPAALAVDRIRQFAAEVLPAVSLA
jgi:probable F420-dependent oxidoreductase